MGEFDARRAAFRQLHKSGCFVMPNPWDIGTAKYLEKAGFPAVATTSAGFAFARGLPDSASALPRDLVLAHVAEIVQAVSLPVNADFQSGYGATTEEIGASVARCVAAGVAGLSIEDATGDPDKPLYELSEALDRLAAARSAIDVSGADVMLTARAECFLVGHPDSLRESIRRLEAYREAGADVLFAPGANKPDEIRAIVQVAGSKPLNALVSANTGLGVADLAELGVRRISLGSSLARTAWTGFIRTVDLLAREGSFAGLDGATSFAALNSLFEG